MPKDREDKKGSYQPPTEILREPVTVAQLRSWPGRRRYHDASTRASRVADMTAEWTATPPPIPRPQRRVGEVAKPGGTKRHGTTEAERRAHREAGKGPNLSPPKSMPLAEIRERQERRIQRRERRADRRARPSSGRAPGRR